MEEIIGSPMEAAGYLCGYYLKRYSALIEVAFDPEEHFQAIYKKNGLEIYSDIANSLNEAIFDLETELMCLEKDEEYNLYMPSLRNQDISVK